MVSLTLKFDDQESSFKTISSWDDKVWKFEKLQIENFVKLKIKKSKLSLLFCKGFF